MLCGVRRPSKRLFTLLVRTRELPRTEAGLLHLFSVGLQVLCKFGFGKPFWGTTGTLWKTLFFWVSVQPPEDMLHLLAVVPAGRGPLSSRGSCTGPAPVRGGRLAWIKGCYPKQRAHRFVGKTSRPPSFGLNMKARVALRVPPARYCFGSSPSETFGKGLTPSLRLNFV